MTDNLESSGMEVDASEIAPPAQPAQTAPPAAAATYLISSTREPSRPPSAASTPPPQPTVREMFRNLSIRLHLRRPGRDSWTYLGRATVSHEVLAGQTSRVVVRSAPDKILTVFGEHSDLQAERRNHFVVVSCVEPEGILSWSLNAVNMADTLRLLASIELACYKPKQMFNDPRQFSTTRRKIERMIRDDRRQRHRRKRDEDDMITAFGQQQLQ